MPKTLTIEYKEYELLKNNLEILEKALQEKARSVWVGRWPLGEQVYYFSDEDLEEIIKRGILRNWGVTIDEIIEFQKYKKLPWYKRILGFLY